MFSSSAPVPPYARQPDAFAVGEGIQHRETEGRRYLGDTTNIAVSTIMISTAKADEPVQSMSAPICDLLAEQDALMAEVRA